MLKRVAIAAGTGITLFVSLLAGPTPTAQAAPGTAAGPLAVNTVADPSGPIPKPPKPTHRDRTLTKATWAKDNHAPPPDYRLPSVLTGTSRDYGVGSLGLTGTGMDGNVYMASPFVTNTDNGGTGLIPHSIGQIVVSSDSQAHQIEAGWRATASGGVALFVSAWVSGSWLGYGTSFTLYGSRTYSPGDAIPGAHLGTSKKFLIQWDGTTSCGATTGAWWISYDSTWMGYYCANLFPAATGLRTGTMDFSQAFGEYAYDTTRGYFCGDMGNGTQGSTGAGAAVFGSLRIFGQATTNPPTDYFVRTIPAAATHITVNKASARTFYYGGPGKNSTGTAVGSSGSC